MTDELKPYAVTVSFFDKHSGRMGITWQTKAKGQPALWYTDPEDTLFERASVLDANVSDGAAFDTVCFKNCALTPDFEPGTDILYRVGDKSGVFSEPSILHIPKDDADRFAFAVFTDTQDTDTVGNWWEAALLDADEVFPQYGFIAHCGDIVETSVSFENWAKMLGNTAKHTRAYPLAAAPGNHDYWKWYLRDIVGSFYSHFNVSLPPQNTDYGAYYSVERGNILILVLSTGDTNLTGGTLGKEQYEWAKKELSESRMKWKTVLIHNPLFSPGKYGSRVPNNDHCLKLRAQLCPLFSDGGVDLVICGHDHMYARTYPISADGTPVTNAPSKVCNYRGRSAEYFTAAAGPIHFEPACAGHQNRGIECEMTPELSAPFREMRETGYGEVSWSAVDADGDTLTILFRTIDIESGKCVFESAFGLKK